MLTGVLMALLSTSIFNVSRAQHAAPIPSSEATPLLAPTSAFQTLETPSSPDPLAANVLGRATSQLGRQPSLEAFDVDVQH